jgi:hypothetical protein
MRKKGISVIALLMLCSSLLGAGQAFAATGEQSSSDGKGGLDAGSISSNRPFFEPLDAYCESSCCWAWCSGDGCSVDCSESSCFAQSGGQSAKYTCSQA